MFKRTTFFNENKARQKFEMTIAEVDCPAGPVALLTFYSCRSENEGTLNAMLPARGSKGVSQAVEKSPPPLRIIYPNSQ